MVIALAVLAAAGFTTVAVVVVSILTEKHPEALTANGPQPTRSTNRLNDAVDASPMLRRAIEVTANLADRRGTLGSVERSLRAADIPMRPAEVIFGYVALAVVAPLVALVLLRSMQLTVLSLVLFVLLPPQALRFAVKRRRKRFVRQLPDALTTLAGSLRAGRSLGQALDALAREMPMPIGRELRKVV